MIFLYTNWVRYLGKSAMRDLKIETYQFFSRGALATGKTWHVRTSPLQNSDILFSLHFEHCLKPFEMTFAELFPHRSAIGAHQPIDRHLDGYFSLRWPACLAARGTISVPDSPTFLTSDVRMDLLRFARRVLWEMPGGIQSDEIPIDQRANVVGYRREFVHSQTFDIFGSRRPSELATFANSEVHEPVGPGVATIFEYETVENLNELVWSPILPFQNRTEVIQDKELIRVGLNALWRHYNSYMELADARRHLSQKEVKASIRAAASAVEACINHMRQVSLVAVPKKGIPFDQKIEDVLAAAGRSSFRALEPVQSKHLLHLYRARNSMHDGDCYYEDNRGAKIRVTEVEQASVLVHAAEAFILWAEPSV